VVRAVIGITRPELASWTSKAPSPAEGATLAPKYSWCSCASGQPAARAVPSTASMKPWRAADVDMFTGPRRTEQRAQVQLLRGVAVVEVELHRRTERAAGDAVVEGRPPARTGAVVHLEGRPGARQPLGHAQDRRDADAAGQQQVPPRIVRQRESGSSAG
jgi:hypothetical protein